MEYMVAGKTLSDYTNLFFLQITIKRMASYKYFKDKYGKRKSKP